MAVKLEATENVFGNVATSNDIFIRFHFRNIVISMYITSKIGRRKAGSRTLKVLNFFLLGTKARNWKSGDQKPEEEADEQLNA